MKVAGLFPVALVAALLGPGASGAAQDVEALADKHRCFMCHSVEQKLVGPAFRDVARRYKDDAQAVDRLAAKVRRGGSGNWGQVSMPPNNVSETDVRTLLRWVLSSS